MRTGRAGRQRGRSHGAQTPCWVAPDPRGRPGSPCRPRLPYCSCFSVPRLERDLRWTFRDLWGIFSYQAPVWRGCSWKWIYTGSRRSWGSSLKDFRPFCLALHANEATFASTLKERIELPCLPHMSQLHRCNNVEPRPGI